MIHRRRVVVTGLGVVSPLGNSLSELYGGLRAGKCAIREMTEWKQGVFRDGHFLGAPASLPEEFIRKIPRVKRRSMSNLALYASCAAMQAVEDSKLSVETLMSPRTGCVIGSTMGGTSAISESYRILNFGGGVTEMPAMQFFKSVSHTAAFNVSHLLGITGVVQAPCAACASAVQAVGQGRDLIAYGTQDVVLCGGAEELAPEVSGSFEVIFAGLGASPLPPEKSSRPFDAERKGLVCGEGAGILLLEELEHAQARGARIYGEIIGYATCGCGSQISQSDSESILRCIDMVCRDADLLPERIGYVNAHATSTVQGDAAEAEALKTYFPHNPYVSSLKGHLGHTLGASGALELAACFEMLNRSELLPTLNLETPGAGCEGLNYLFQPLEIETDVVLKNSFAFGGINASVLCKKYLK